MKTYTVIGIYNDDRQVWSTSVRAANPTNAARDAVREMMDSRDYENDDGSDIGVVEVLEGEPVCCVLADCIKSGKEILEEAG